MRSIVVHLEPWQCSISYVKHTIFVYYDIDSILTRYRTSENDVRYRDTILNSISKIKYSILMHYDIEEPLALLPILKGSACLETNDDWVRHRRMELYHSSMDHIIADINELCLKDMYL